MSDDHLSDDHLSDDHLSDDHLSDDHLSDDHLSDDRLSVVVVPCFNEATRLDQGAFVALAETGTVQVLFVNDGSTDGTKELLDDLAESAAGVDVLHLQTNRGKAEAVRHGLVHALDRGAAVVGYLDADLSTPTQEYRALLDALDLDASLQVVLGSRVALLGTHIERRARRHYLGRVFGTLASVTLGMPVYDTQCGAKALRASPALREALDHPFTSRWVFDVELIGRLRSASKAGPGLPVDAFRELPLQTWQDVPGGTLRPLQMCRALVDLGRIAWDQHRAKRPSRKDTAG